MTPREWLALFAFYAAYLFFGTSVFYHVEHQLETDRRAVALQERIEINEILTRYTAPDDEYLQQQILEQVSEYCGKKVTNHTLDEYVAPYVWNYYHTFFFTFIVCSTIGYGNISPNNTFGRIFMIFYALIGIPVHGFVFAYMGDLWGKTFTRLYRRYKAYKLSADSRYVPRQFSLIGQIILYLIPGIIIFIFIPACLFTYFEKWDYSVSVYYAFVTLTTIGFGDFVPTFQPHQEHVFGLSFIFYEVFIILWFFTGVGYLVMIIGFIAKGMRSKKMARLEKQLAANLKETHQRIWHGVTKDVGYIRKILNEVYMLKFKPVYHDPGEKFTCHQVITKSESCPDLTMYHEKTPLTRRKRACSESMFGKDQFASMSTITRGQSDSDLQKINRDKTFGINALVQPGELLAKVVTALSTMRTTEDDGQSILDMAISTPGINCFTDSQILASERTWSGWSLGMSEKSYTNPPRSRPRAASDIGLPMPDHLHDSNEWTWSGANTQINEIMRIRQKGIRPKEDLYRATLTGGNKIKKYDSCFTIDMPTEPPPKIAAATNKSLLSKLNPFKKRVMDQNLKRHSITPTGRDVDSQTYLNMTRKGRSSMFNLPHQYLSQTSAGRQSLLSMPSTHEEVLENTTIADLIRALELVHTQVNLPDSGSFENLGEPRRKLGTASLTPPKVPSLLTLFPTNMENTLRRGSVRPPLMQSLSNPSNGTKFPVNLGHDSSPFIRHSSIRPVNPPPYTLSSESPKVLRRRFSVRPSNLSVPPGQCPRSGSVTMDTAPTLSSSVQPTLQIPTTTLQRRLSLRPNPISKTQQTTSKTNQWRPAYLREFDITSRPATKAGSLSNLYEKRTDDRRRTDSK